MRRQRTRDLRQLVAMLRAGVTELQELVLERGQACFERRETVRGFDSLALELLGQLADPGAELLRANAVRTPEQTHGSSSSTIAASFARSDLDRSRSWARLCSSSAILLLLASPAAVSAATCSRKVVRRSVAAARLASSWPSSTSPSLAATSGTSPRNSASRRRSVAGVTTAKQASGPSSARSASRRAVAGSATAAHGTPDSISIRQPRSCSAWS